MSEREFVTDWVLNRMKRAKYPWSINDVEIWISVAKAAYAAIKESTNA